MNETDVVMESSETLKNKKKKRTATSYAISFFLKIAVTILVVWALLTWVVRIDVCHDNSAYPMIKDGDFCLTYRLESMGVSL